MKRFVFFQVGVLALIAGLFLSCSNPALTQYDPGYQGNYSFTLNARSNNFYAFATYSISYTQGSDLYSSITVTTDTAGGIDTTIFKSTLTNDSVQLYFLKVFSGHIYVVCTRPNSRVDTFPYEISVKSPMSITGPAVLPVGDSARYACATVAGVPGIHPELLRVVWTIDTTLLDTLGAKDSLQVCLQKSGLHSLNAMVIDGYNNRLPLPALTLATTPGATVQFASDTVYEIPGSKITLEAIGTGVSYSWAVDGTAIGSTVSPETTLVLFADSAAPRLVTAFAIDSNGFKGKPDTLVVKYLRALYTLQFTNANDSVVTIRDTTKWQVRAVNAITGLASSGAYTWILTDASHDTVLDSAGPALSAMNYYAAKASTFALTVLFTDSTGLNHASALRSFTVVDIYPQVDTVLVNQVPVYTGKADTLTAITIVSETKSPVKQTRWSFGADTTHDTTVSQLSISHVFTDTGLIAVGVSCTDSAGRTSTRYTMKVAVLDGRPVIDSLTFSDTAFSMKSFTITVSAHDPTSSALDSAIILLSKGADTLRFASSKLTQTITLGDTGKAGTYRVSAVALDNNGLWSNVKLAADSLIIEKGNPSIVSVLYDTVWYKDSATFTITASDPASTVSKLCVAWGDSAGRIDTITAGSGGSTVCKHLYQVLPPANALELQISAIDANGLQSAPWQKGILVHEGLPQRFIVPLKYTDPAVSGAQNYRTFVYNDTLYSPWIDVADNYFGGEYIGSTYHFLVSTAAMDSNGTVAEGVVDVKPPYDRTSTDSCTRELTNDTAFILTRDPMYFSPDSQPRKIVLYARDDGGLWGADTFFVKTKNALNLADWFNYVSAMDTVKSADMTVKTRLMRLSNLDRTFQDSVTIQRKIFWEFYGGSSGSSGYLDSMTLTTLKLSQLGLTTNDTCVIPVEIPSTATNFPQFAMSVTITDMVGNQENCGMHNFVISK